VRKAFPGAASMTVALSQKWRRRVPSIGAPFHEGTFGEHAMRAVGDDVADGRRFSTAEWLVVQYWCRSVAALSLAVAPATSGNVMQRTPEEPQPEGRTLESLC